jgi:transposase-like protein
VLVCWCITTSGCKVLLHLAVGDKESEACWTEFFRHMISRGLRVPTSVTADGAPGLINAIGVCFPRSIRIRCWFHRMGNILAKVPEEAKAELAAHMRAVRSITDIERHQLKLLRGSRSTRRRRRKQRRTAREEGRRRDSGRCIYRSVRT